VLFTNGGVPVPKITEIYCKTCYVVQEWKGQTHCTNPSCGTRLSNWHIAKQLGPQQKHAS
jgi:hypothetical protein